MLTQQLITLQQTQVFIHNYSHLNIEHSRTASGPRTRQVDILAMVVTATE